MGICLDINPGELEAIAQEHRDNCERCLSKVLQLWTKEKHDANWDDVIEMLISPAINEKALTQKIKKEFRVYMKCRHYNNYNIKPCVHEAL